MLKTLGLIETRSLIGAVAAADIMLKNTDVEIIGKEHLASGEVILILSGETPSVELGLNMGAEKARELGQLKLFYIIPKPNPELAKILKDIIPFEKSADVKQKSQDAPVNKEQERKINVESTVTEPAEKVKKTSMRKKSSRGKNNPDGKADKKSRNKIRREHRVEPKDVIKDNPVAGEHNFSLFGEQKNDTIARLRKEALGLTGSEEESHAGTSGTRNKEAGRLIEKKNGIKTDDLTPAFEDKYVEEDIQQMNVHKLRKLARGIDNFPIKGREISKANRNELLEFFHNLK